MSKPTFEDLIKKTRLQLQDPEGNYWSDEEIAEYLDEGQLEYVRKTEALRGQGPILKKINNDAYALPDDCLLLTRLEDFKGTEIQRTTLGWGQRMSGNFRGGSTGYAASSENIGFSYSDLDGDGAIRFHPRPSPTIEESTQAFLSPVALDPIQKNSLAPQHSDLKDMVTDGNYYYLLRGTTLEKYNLDWSLVWSSDQSGNWDLSAHVKLKGSLLAIRGGATKGSPIAKEYLNSLCVLIPKVGSDSKIFEYNVADDSSPTLLRSITYVGVASGAGFEHIIMSKSNADEFLCGILSGSTMYSCDHTGSSGQIFADFGSGEEAIFVYNIAYNHNNQRVICSLGPKGCAVGAVFTATTSRALDQILTTSPCYLVAPVNTLSEATDKFFYQSGATFYTILSNNATFPPTTQVEAEGLPAIRQGEGFSNRVSNNGCFCFYITASEYVARVDIGALTGEEFEGEYLSATKGAFVNEEGTLFWSYEVDSSFPILEVPSTDNGVTRMDSVSLGGCESRGVVRDVSSSAVEDVVSILESFGAVRSVIISSSGITAYYVRKPRLGVVEVSEPLALVHYALYKCYEKDSDQEHQQRAAMNNAKFSKILRRDIQRVAKGFNNSRTPVRGHFF